MSCEELNELAINANSTDMLQHKQVVSRYIDKLKKADGIPFAGKRFKSYCILE